MISVVHSEKHGNGETIKENKHINYTNEHQHTTKSPTPKLFPFRSVFDGRSILKVLHCSFDCSLCFSEKN